jgi:serine protease Do
MKIWRPKTVGAVGAITAIGVIALIGTRFVAAPSARGQVSLGQWQRVGGGSSIGVSVTDVDAAAAARQKLTSTTGALVGEVRANGPAAKAGVKVDDLILTFDGETVRSSRQLVRLVEETPAGREVPITLVREGVRMNLKVTVEESSEPFTAFLSGNSPLRDFQFFNGPNWSVTPQPFFLDSLNPADRSGRRLGVEVQELTGQLGEFFGTKEGVLVTTVLDGTPAKTAGMKAGDVITKFNGRPVLNADELRRRITGATGDVTIAIMRDRKELALTVKLDGGTPREIIK